MESMSSLKDGMKNKAHVLELCRLMVRAEKAEHRLTLLKIIQVLNVLIVMCQCSSGKVINSVTQILIYFVN